MGTIIKAIALILPSRIGQVNICTWPMDDLQWIRHGVSTSI
jgi:hypothetical protein